MDIFDTIEFKLISEHYCDKVAKRSKVPLINHIIEGVTILKYINASEDAMKAFCLHPLVQADLDLMDNFEYLASLNLGRSLLLSLEYRNIANAYLSYVELQSSTFINLSPLEEVNDMLRADKIQNYKDFLIYHKGKHSNSENLDRYFNNWLKRLNCEGTFLMLQKLLPGEQSGIQN